MRPGERGQRLINLHLDLVHVVASRSAHAWAFAAHREARPGNLRFLPWGGSVADHTLTILLTGGIGSRLQPLTADRAKFAVPFGGKYRVIVFPLSNGQHSGPRRLLVLTQYKSHSRHKHLRDGWSILNPSGGNTSPSCPAEAHRRLLVIQNDWSIRTYHGQNPPARMVPGESGKDGLMTNSIQGAGTVIIGGIVRHSILASRVYIHEEAVMEDAILFDHVTVGRGAKLRRCIVDKPLCIPPGEAIGHDGEKDRQRFTCSDKGIMMVPEDYRFE